MLQSKGLNLREKDLRIRVRIKHVSGLNSSVGNGAVMRTTRNDFGVFKGPAPCPSTMQMVGIGVRDQNGGDFMWLDIFYRKRAA